jgi:predicted GH43/DUF377 family glycosyl hydrolase
MVAVQRSTLNPIISPADLVASRPDFDVIGVLNAGVTRLGDEVILLLRVVERPRNDREDCCLVPIYDVQTQQIKLEALPRGGVGYDFSDPRLVQTPHGVYLTGISHLRVARSRDGLHFTTGDTPAMSAANAYETYGIEDPHITKIADTYYISYVGVSQLGIVTSLATTRDFTAFEHLGVIFAPDNKDIQIFPEQIQGKYYALHRPSTSVFGRPEIWLAESPDLRCWGNHRHIVGQRAESWDNRRIGGSAVPFRVDAGWLAIYHGADTHNRYCLGALLLDLDEPWRVLARSVEPLMVPETDYEINGFFGNVIFSCGALCEGGVVKLYYGAADTSMAYAEISLDDIYSHLHLERSLQST